MAKAARDIATNTPIPINPAMLFSMFSPIELVVKSLSK
jgi:hypothetical protein